MPTTPTPTPTPTQTTSVVQYVKCKEEEDDYDLIDFGIESNGGYNYMKKK